MTIGSGVGCFKGCTNPVIGQCSGYQESCGSFYCVEHSNEKLCIDCWGRKLNDEKIQLLYEEYLSLAESISSANWIAWFKGMALGLILAVSILFFGEFFGFGELGLPGKHKGNVGYLVFGIIIALIGLFLIFKGFVKSINSASLIKRHFDTKPGFEKFYTEWQKQKSKESLKIVVGLALGVTAAAVSLHEANQQKKDRQNLQDIRDELRKK